MFYLIGRKLCLDLLLISPWSYFPYFLKHRISFVLLQCVVHWQLFSTSAMEPNLIEPDVSDHWNRHSFFHVYIFMRVRDQNIPPRSRWKILMHTVLVLALINAVQLHGLAVSVITHTSGVFVNIMVVVHVTVPYQAFYKIIYIFGLLLTMFQTILGRCWISQTFPPNCSFSADVLLHLPLPIWGLQIIPMVFHSILTS